MSPPSRSQFRVPLAAVAVAVAAAASLLSAPSHAWSALSAPPAHPTAAAGRGLSPSFDGASSALRFSAASPPDIGETDAEVSEQPPPPRADIKDDDDDDDEGPVQTTKKASVETTKTTDDDEFDVEILLDAALRSDPPSALRLLERVSSLRRSGRSDEAEAFLDSVLAVAEGGERRPPWILRAGFLRGPASRLSRRSRRAAMSRTLDLSTPAAEDDESGGGAEEAARRRRRALAVLLRALAEDGGGDGTEEGRGSSPLIPSPFPPRSSIRALEKAALRDAGAGVLFFDAGDRLTPGLETPKYEIVARRRAGGYEIRRYDPYSVCSVSMDKKRPADGERTDAKISQPTLSGASSFGALAGYLFGKNSDSAAMKMTTPVLSSAVAGEDGGGEREMSFVLPSEYWDESGTDRAPAPLDGSGVSIRRDTGGLRAVLAFGGFSSKKVADGKKLRLLETLGADDDYEIDDSVAAGDASLVYLAQYNDPFTPPWKRRNEVVVSVRPKHE